MLLTGPLDPPHWPLHCGFYWDCGISDLVMGCSRVGIGGGVSSLDDSLGVSSNIGLRLCAEFGKYWEERFDVPSTIDWRIFNTFLDACLLVVLSCVKTWLDCRAALFIPCSFDVLVFNSTFRMIQNLGIAYYSLYTQLSKLD